jgi:hypothetical protein
MGLFGNSSIKVNDLEQALKLAGFPDLSGIIQRGLAGINVKDAEGKELQEGGNRRISEALAVFAQETAAAAKKRDAKVADGSALVNAGNLARKEAAANRKTMVPLLKYVKNDKK